MRIKKNKTLKLKPNLLYNSYGIGLLLFLLYKAGSELYDKLLPLFSPISKLFNEMNNKKLDTLDWPFLASGALNLLNVAMPDFSSIYWVKIVNPGELIISSDNDWWWQKIMSSNPECAFLSLSIYNNLGLPIQSFNFDKKTFWKGKKIHIKYNITEKAAIIFRVYSYQFDDKSGSQIKKIIDIYHNNLPTIRYNNRLLKRNNLNNVINYSKNISIKATDLLTDLMNRLHGSKCDALAWKMVGGGDKVGLFPNSSAMYMYKCIGNGKFKVEIDESILEKIISNKNVRYVGVMLSDATTTATKKSFSLYFYNKKININYLSFNTNNIKLPILVLRVVSMNTSHSSNIPSNYLKLLNIKKVL